MKIGMKERKISSVKEKAKELWDKNQEKILVAGVVISSMFTGYMLGSAITTKKIDVGLNLICLAKPGLREDMKNAIDAVNKLKN